MRLFLLGFKAVLFANVLSAQAEPVKTVSMDELKQIFIEKKVSEAVGHLKIHHKTLLKSPAHQKQLADWLSAFQYDSSLGLFEKTLELMMGGGDLSAMDQNLQIILEKEPYNLPVSLHHLKLLIEQQQIKKAREKIAWAQEQMPYLEGYRLYSAWMDLSEGLPVQKISCLHPTLNEPLKDFCFYVKVLEELQQKNLQRASLPLAKLLLKTSLPNKHLALWKKWKKAEDKQKYLSSCAAMSGKQKKMYLFVPDFCKTDDKDARE